MSQKMPETERKMISRNPYQGKFKRVLCVSVTSQTHYPKDSLPPIKVLNIPDLYSFRELKLITLIKRAYDLISKET